MLCIVMVALKLPACRPNVRGERGRAGRAADHFCQEVQFMPGCLVSPPPLNLLNEHCIGMWTYKTSTIFVSPAVVRPNWIGRIIVQLSEDNAYMYACVQMCGFAPRLSWPSVHCTLVFEA